MQDRMGTIGVFADRKVPGLPIVERCFVGGGITYFEHYVEPPAPQLLLEDLRYRELRFVVRRNRDPDRFVVISGLGGQALGPLRVADIVEFRARIAPPGGLLPE